MIDSSRYRGGDSRWGEFSKELDTQEGLGWKDGINSVGESFGVDKNSMSEAPKVVYIYVVNDEKEKNKENIDSSFSYNIYAKIHLSHTFQLMGCKAKDSHEIADLMFGWLSHSKKKVELHRLKKSKIKVRRTYSLNETDEEEEDEEDRKKGGYSNDSSSSSYSDTDQYYNDSPVKASPTFTENESITKYLEPVGVRINKKGREKEKMNKDIRYSSSPRRKNLYKKFKQSSFNISLASIKSRRDNLDEVYQVLEKQLSKMINENEYMLSVMEEQREYPKNGFSMHRIDSLYQNEIVILRRKQFDDLAQIVLTTYDYSRPSRITDFSLACRIQERKLPVVIFFAGTSGCGKSTLASLIASKLGISRVLSTDNIRHMLRGYISKKEQPVLYASTYHAGEHLPKEEKYLKLTPNERTIEGYRKQSETVLEHLEYIITQCEERRECLVIEGVHLLTDKIVDIMKRHKCIVPYLIYISNDTKHKERFAVRAKYMTLEARNNKYVQYFENIRCIQSHLIKHANACNIPLVDNTNIDRSIAIIHHSIFKCLKRMYIHEEPLVNEKSTKTRIQPLNKPPGANLWSSKRMLQVIQEKRETLEQRNMLKKHLSFPYVKSTRGRGTKSTSPYRRPLNKQSKKSKTTKDVEQKRISFDKDKYYYEYNINGAESDTSRNRRIVSGNPYFSNIDKDKYELWSSRVSAKNRFLHRSTSILNSIGNFNPFHLKDLRNKQILVAHEKTRSNDSNLWRRNSIDVIKPEIIENIMKPETVVSYSSNSEYDEDIRDMSSQKRRNSADYTLDDIIQLENILFSNNLSGISDDGGSVQDFGS